MAQIKDKTSLLAMHDIGLIDKGEWTILGRALYPETNLVIPASTGPANNASTFIEDIVGIVFK